MSVMQMCYVNILTASHRVFRLPADVFQAVHDCDIRTLHITETLHYQTARNVIDRAACLSHTVETRICFVCVLEYRCR
jgi:hypothetical protein